MTVRSAWLPVWFADNSGGSSGRDDDGAKAAGTRTLTVRFGDMLLCRRDAVQPQVVAFLDHVLQVHSP
jgi:hypothetical protein